MIGKDGQVHAIKTYLESGRILTSMRAYEMFGCTRLAAQIYDLKKSGMKIDTIMVNSHNRYGKVCTYAEYYLRRDNNE